MKMNIKKYLPGIGKQYFIDPAHIDARGGLEKYLPSLGVEVEIPADCISTIGGADKYIPGLGRCLFILPAHIRYSPSVVFTVTHNAVAVAGLTVYFNNTYAVTDSQGKATFTNVASDIGAIRYQIKGTGYTTTIGSATIVNASDDIEVGVAILGSYTITFHVKDEALANISGASITFNGETKLTDVDGNAVFNTVSENATAAYTVTKATKTTIDTTANITADATIEVTMIAS